jgi:hypothetical protein
MSFIPFAVLLIGAGVLYWRVRLARAMAVLTFIVLIIHLMISSKASGSVSNLQRAIRGCQTCVLRMKKAKSPTEICYENIRENCAFSGYYPNPSQVCSCAGRKSQNRQDRK